jgi:hypothetical protein
MPGDSDDMGNGFTNKEILLQIQAAQTNHISRYNNDMLRIELALGNRPSRTEVFSWLAGVGTLSGIIFGLISFVA